MKLRQTLYLAIFTAGAWLIEKAEWGAFAQDDQYVQHRDGDVTIGGLVFIQGDDVLGLQTVETINMIVDMINEDKKVLPNITLGTMILDTKGDDSYTLQQIVGDFFPQFSTASGTCETTEATDTAPLFAGIIGASSSDRSIQSAKLLQVFSIPQISYWATNPSLSDKSMFPYFFRTIPSDRHQVQAISSFISQQGWDYVSIVYENTNYGSRAFSAFKEIAEEKGICVAVENGMPRHATVTDYINVVRKLNTKPTAQAVVMFTGLHRNVKGILKAAATDPGTAGRFIWLATDAWTRLLPDLKDDLEAYESELDGTIGFAPKTDPIVGFDEYFTQITLKERINSSLNPWFPNLISIVNNCSIGPDSVSSPEKRMCRDDDTILKETHEQFPYTENVANAVLLFAHSVHEVHKEICNGTPGLCDEMKKMRGTNKLAIKTYEALKRINVTGINGGLFKFDENQDAPSDYYVYNYKKEIKTPPGKELEKWIKIADVDSKGIKRMSKSQLSNKVKQSNSYCTENCVKHQARIISVVKCCWTCQSCTNNQFVLNGSECVDCKKGTKPNELFTDCEAIPVEFIHYSKPHSISSILLGVIGTLLTAITAAIYVKKGSSPIVKASGQELCFVTLFGIFLTFTNCWTVMAPPSKASCIASRLILSFGPVLMYSSLLSKTLRVMIIFRSKILSPKTKLFLQPTSQLFLTGLISMVQGFLVIIWLIVAPAKVELYQDSSNFVFRSCETLIHLPILIGLAYPFLLIMICTVLAILNRGVPIGFNEAKFIGFTMYSTCVIWLAFVPIFVTSENKYELKLMTVSICLSLSAFTVLLCMFAHRCYTLLFQPEMNTQRSVMSSRHTPKESIKSDSIPVRRTTNRESVVVETPT